MKMSAMDTYIEWCEKVIDSKDVEIAELKQKLTIQEDCIKTLTRENENLQLELGTHTRPSVYLMEFFDKHFSDKRIAHCEKRTEDVSQCGFDALLECWKFGLIEFSGRNYYWLTDKGESVLSEYRKSLKALDADNCCHY
jgi:hypothetical protein